MTSKGITSLLIVIVVISGILGYSVAASSYSPIKTVANDEVIKIVPLGISDTLLNKVNNNIEKYGFRIERIQLNYDSYYGKANEFVIINISSSGFNISEIDIHSIKERINRGTPIMFVAREGVNVTKIKQIIKLCINNSILTRNLVNTLNAKIYRTEKSSWKMSSEEAVKVVNTIVIIKLNDERIPKIIIARVVRSHNNNPISADIIAEQMADAVQLTVRGDL